MTDLDITNGALLNRQLSRLTCFSGEKNLQENAAGQLNDGRVVLSIDSKNKLIEGFFKITQNQLESPSIFYRGSE